MSSNPTIWPPPTPEEFRIYEIFRRRITEEDALINNRLSWLIWLEASLLTAWGVIASGHSIIGFDQEFVLAFLGFFGSIMSIAVLAAVWAAHIEIKRCKADYKNNYTHIYKNPRIPRITGNKLAHNIGHIVPFLAPAMFLLAQGCLFYADLRLAESGGQVALQPKPTPNPSQPITSPSAPKQKE